MVPLYLVLFGLSLQVKIVYGHGRLVEPASRASAWRYGFPTPPDYTDNEGYCGGVSHQHGRAGGKCGICGDPWFEDPRDHEAPGGRYATGTITQWYKSGQVIPVTIQITANHFGYFVFKLCANNNVKKDPEQDCFDRNVLNTTDGRDMWQLPDQKTGFYDIKLQLPEGVKCKQCILQWTYNTANSWGRNENGERCLGCGPQETFRACADISIGSKRDAFDYYYDYYNGDINFQYNEIDRIGLSLDEDYFEEEERSSKFLPLITSDDVLICDPTSTYRDQIGMKKWCTDNCNHIPKNCPESMCVCRGSGSAQENLNEIETVTLTCKPTQPFKHVSGMKNWCEDNCNGATKFCPETFCNCMPKNRPSSARRNQFGSRAAIRKQKQRKNISRLKKEEKIRLHLRRKEINNINSDQNKDVVNETKKFDQPVLRDNSNENKTFSLIPATIETSNTLTGKLKQVLEEKIKSSIEFGAKIINLKKKKLNEKSRGSVRKKESNNFRFITFKNRKRNKLKPISNRRISFSSKEDENKSINKEAILKKFHRNNASRRARIKTIKNKESINRKAILETSDMPIIRKEEKEQDFRKDNRLLPGQEDLIGSNEISHQKDISNMADNTTENPFDNDSYFALLLNHTNLEIPEQEMTTKRPEVIFPKPKTFIKSLSLEELMKLKNDIDSILNDPKNRIMNSNNFHKIQNNIGQFLAKESSSKELDEPTSASFSKEQINEKKNRIQKISKVRKMGKNSLQKRILQIENKGKHEDKNKQDVSNIKQDSKSFALSERIRGREITPLFGNFVDAKVSSKPINNKTLSRNVYSISNFKNESTIDHSIDRNKSIKDTQPNTSDLFQDNNIASHSFVTTSIQNKSSNERTTTISTATSKSSSIHEIVNSNGITLPSSTSTVKPVLSNIASISSTKIIKQDNVINRALDATNEKLLEEKLFSSKNTKSNHTLISPNYISTSLNNSSYSPSSVSDLDTSDQQLESKKFDENIPKVISSETSPKKIKTISNSNRTNIANDLERNETTILLPNTSFEDDTNVDSSIKLPFNVSSPKGLNPNVYDFTAHRNNENSEIDTSTNIPNITTEGSTNYLSESSTIPTKVSEALSMDEFNLFHSTSSPKDMNISEVATILTEQLIIPNKTLNPDIIDENHESPILRSKPESKSKPTSMMLLPLNSSLIDNRGNLEEIHQIAETVRSSQSSSIAITPHQEENITITNLIPSQAKNVAIKHDEMKHVGKMNIKHVPKFKKCDKYKMMTICYYEEPAKDPFPDIDEAITENEPFQIINSNPDVKNNLLLLAQINDSP